MATTASGPGPEPPSDRSSGASSAALRWVPWLSELTGYLSGVALVVATFVTVHAVVVRYFLGLPTIWQTEMTIYLLMFVTFVGAAYGLKHHAHVGVDLIVDRLPTRPQLVLRLVTAVACLAVVLIVFWTSYQFWHEAWEGDFRSPTAWRAPLWIPYAILPLGMLLVALQYLAMIVEGLLGLTGRVPMHRVSLMAGTSEASHLKDHVNAAPEADEEERR